MSRGAELVAAKWSVSLNPLGNYLTNPSGKRAERQTAVNEKEEEEEGGGAKAVRGDSTHRARGQVVFSPHRTLKPPHGATGDFRAWWRVTGLHANSCQSHSGVTQKHVCSQEKPEESLFVLPLLCKNSPPPALIKLA